MKDFFCRKTLYIILLSFFSSGFTLFAQQGSITGTVFDETNTPLSFASVQIQGTTIGASADINGKFVLMGVSVGSQVVTVSFLGYETKTIPVTVKKDEAIDLKIAMEPMAIQGKEVVITAQMRGQTHAINQQLNASGIVSVVSQEKMKELPDGNAADAAGRLPGVMVQRSGGEGEKLIIRGLDPKYSTVSVNGVVAPSSSATDRSTNMNLISPDIISGIEVSKANTANQDADGMGGTVNMLVREADANRRLNAVVQGGYSGQIEEISNYKATLFYSERFFQKKLGMMLSGNIESYDRSADRMTASYEINGRNLGDLLLGQINLRATTETRERYNASAIFDFRFNPKHTIKMVNMYSQTDRDVFQRRRIYVYSSGTNNDQLRFNQVSSNPTSNMLSSALDGKHILGNTELTWAASFSRTASDTPNEHELQFRHSGVFYNYTEASGLDPLEATNPIYTKENIRGYSLYQGTLTGNENKETEWGGKVDYKIPFSISDGQVSGNIQVGGKVRIKDRNRETNRWASAGAYQTGNSAVNSVTTIKDRYLYEPDLGNGIGLMSFLDPTYKSKKFLNGESPYMKIDYALDRDVVQRFFDNNNPYPMSAELSGRVNTGNLYSYTPNARLKDEYETHEDLYAAYVMSEINIGKMITFIPGVRFDYQYIDYMAYKGEGIPENENADIDLSSLEKQWDDNSQTFFLPQIHLKVKPLPWFDIRLAYTQTISRPDYDYLAPRTQIYTTAQRITYSTTKINSSKSENLDAILSFFHNKYGLFTIGAFRKNISNFIYQRNALILAGTATNAATFGLQEGVYEGYEVTYPLNNPGKSYINGLEIEGQTNFRWLPANLRALRGVVLSGNVSFMKSKSEYHSTDTERYSEAGRINVDTVFTDRLLKQPALLANVSLGYDYKGFSGRISYSYQDDILAIPQQRPDGFDKESILSFSRWDLQLKQRVNKMVSVYFNMNNIFNNPDKTIRDITGYYSSMEYYGMSMNLGVKIDVF